MGSNVGTSEVGDHLFGLLKGSSSTGMNNLHQIIFFFLIGLCASFSLLCYDVEGAIRLLIIA